MEIKEIFAKNIKRARNKRKWSQQEAADKIGIKRSTLGAYEEGRATPQFENLIVICDVYAVTDVYQFLTNADYDNTNAEVKVSEQPMRNKKILQVIKNKVDLHINE